MNRTTEVTIQDVLLYALNRIHDPARRAFIEATRKVHPELWNARAVRIALRQTENLEEPDATEDQVPEGIVRYNERSKPYTLPLPGPAPKVNWEGRLSFPLPGAATPATPEYFAGMKKDKDNDFWGNHGDTVWLDCPRELIPHGLVFLELTESDGTISKYYPELNFNSNTGNWWFQLSIQKLLGGRRAKDQHPLLRI